MRLVSDRGVKTPEEIHDSLRRKIAIGLMEGAIEKHKYYEMPLPEADRIEKEILAKEGKGGSKHH